MKISQKLDYACRALLHLAQHHDGASVLRTEDIAQAEAIPTAFLAQILHTLKKNELLTSRRGKSGGWQLTKKPAEITLLAVIEAVDPVLLAPAEPSADSPSASAVCEFWNSLNGEIRQSLAQSTLDSIATSEKPNMYFI